VEGCWAQKGGTEKQPSKAKKGKEGHVRGNGKRKGQAGGAGREGMEWEEDGPGAWFFRDWRRFCCFPLVLKH